jgi:hypothetical protein
VLHASRRSKPLKPGVVIASGSWSFIFVIVTAMDIVHLRRYIKSSLVPEVYMPATSYPACSFPTVAHPAAALVTSHEKKAGLKSPSPV